MIYRILSAILIGLFPFLATAQSFTFTIQDFLSENEALDSLTEITFHQLSPEQRAGQMIVTSCGDNGKSIEVVTPLVEEGLIGGVLFLKGSKADHTAEIADFQAKAKATGQLPLMMSTDSEPTLLNSRIRGSAPSKNTSSITDSADAAKIALLITNELKEIGFHHNFAPVVDVAKNSKFISSRSFGADSAQVVGLSQSFILATQSDSIIATAKHFPGHGFVQGDTHKESVYINGELQEVSIYPPLIEAGLLSVMVGHMTVQNNEKWDTEGMPCTLSRNIVTDLLKTELGFKGLIVTDALGMQAVAKFDDGGIKAARAGNDVLLLPRDERKLHRQLLSEMEKDEAFKAQVHASVKKILRMKICLGLITFETK